MWSLRADTIPPQLGGWLLKHLAILPPDEHNERYLLPSSLWFTPIL
jgi:hypothetical protein